MQWSSGHRSRRFVPSLGTWIYALDLVQESVGGTGVFTHLGGGCRVGFTSSGSCAGLLVLFAYTAGVGYRDSVVCDGMCSSELPVRSSDAGYGSVEEWSSAEIDGSQEGWIRPASEADSGNDGHQPSSKIALPPSNITSSDLSRRHTNSRGRSYGVISFMGPMGVLLPRPILEP